MSVIDAKAQTGGGGSFAVENSSVLNLFDLAIDRSTAYVSGAAFLVSNHAQLTVTNCSVEMSNATDGGFVALSKRSVAIMHNVSSNLTTATGKGGYARSKHSQLYLHGCSVYQSNSKYGGALLFEDHSSGNILNDDLCVFCKSILGVEWWKYLCRRIDGYYETINSNKFQCN